MAVSALVLTVDGPFGPRSLPELFRDPRVEVGPPVDRFLPVVTTTSSLQEARDLAEKLSAADGVIDVQLVSYQEDGLSRSRSVGPCNQEVIQ